MRRVFTILLLTVFLGYPAFAVTLERGPYLQNLKPDSVTVVWLTDVPADSKVYYGLTSTYTDSASDSSSVLQHAVTLTGLSEDMIYHYQVESGGDILTGDLTFHSGKGSSFDSFTFVAMGDHRSNPAAHLSVAQRVRLIDPEFIIDTGDLTANGNDPLLWDPEFFIPETDTISRSCFFPSIGNHEGNAVNYLEYFYLPDDSSGSERYYSFDYANAHFIVIDTNISYLPSSAQYIWLENDLIANQTKQWLFAYFHHPPYSACSAHGSDLNVRNTLTPLFELYGIDITFAGHDHNYERGYVNGVYHIVTGGGGAPLYPSGSDWWTQFSASEYHCCKISVNADTLVLQAIKPDGTVLDSFSITKPTSAKNWPFYY